MSFHVRESDGSHDEQTTDHQALAPCLEDQAVGISGAGDWAFVLFGHGGLIS